MAQTLNFTQLQDMIVPEVWQKYILQESTVKTNFWSSGILTDLTPVVGGLLTAGGRTVNMPFYNDLADDGDEIFDDTQDMSVDKIGTDLDVATVIERVKSFGATDLAADLTGDDPMPVIAARFGDWWARRHQVILLALMRGVMGSLAAETANASNHFTASPNNLDITGLGAGASAFDAESFIDAKYRLGDRASDLSALAVHSDTAKVMEKEDLIDYIKPSDGGAQIATYQGKLVIVNDQMPRDANGNYTTYLFGPGAIGYAEGSLPVPVEVHRQPLRGMGRDVLINRRKFAMHVRGVKWVGQPAGVTVSNDELANPANWKRVYDPKLVRVVRFTHKNG